MVVNEPLTMETVLIMIEYWQVLSFYTLTHEHLIEHNVVKLMIESLEKHTHPVMTKAIAGVLFSFGDLKSFSDQFTQEGSIEIILSMVILNQFHYDADIMIRLQETVRVMINQANVKSKFQIAQFGLEIASEMPQPQQ